MESTPTSLRSLELAPRRHRPGAAFAARRRILPGLAAAGAVATVGEVLGSWVPLVGAPVFAIVIGIAIAVVRGPVDGWKPGLAFASKRVLQASIVVLGTGLSLRQVVRTGASSFPVMFGSLTVALVGAWLIGRALSVDRDTRTLIGVGTAICGVSAIAATDAVISASEADVSYSVATIFTFNVAAVLTFPTIGHLMHFSAHSFGLWAGTAINDVSSVVAAATIFGKGASSYAVVVKLTRTLMIIPIAIGLGRLRARRAAATSAVEGTMSVDTPADPPASPMRRLGHVLPLFIAWFLVAVVANSAGLIPGSWHGGLSIIAQAAITVALAGVGLSTRVADIRRAGLRPLALGAMLWLLVGMTSLGIQFVTGAGR